MKTGDIFNNRVISSFGVSIGTGLSLETLFDVTTERYDDSREIPNRVKIDDYTHHVFNLYTIARNIISATGVKDIHLVLNHKDFINVVMYEIHTIFNLYEETGCKPVIFVPNYEEVFKTINLGKESKLSKTHIELDTILNKIKNIRIDNEINVIKNKHILPKLSGKILLTTSISIDLLNKGLELYLLESHTGKIKDKYQWYTKYHPIGKRDMSVFPYLEELVYVLGDKGISLPVKLYNRVALHMLAMVKNWNARTTREKIMNDIKHDKELYAFINGYNKKY